MLYQLSYFRKLYCGQRWIRTTEGVSQQIYSLPHLATLVTTLTQSAAFAKQESDSCGIQTHNLLIRSQMLYSVELRSQHVVFLRGR